MTVHETVRPAGGDLSTALALLGDRRAGNLRRALAGYAVAGAVAGIGRQWIGHARERVTYTLSVPGDDDLYADVHRWLLGHIPTARRRSLTVRTRGEGMAELVSPGGGRPEPSGVRLFYDGTRTQAVRIDGHSVRVSVERPEAAGPPGERSPWGLFRERIVFFAYGAPARDAVMAVLEGLAADRQRRARSQLYLGNRWGDWQRLRDTPGRSLETVVLRQGQRDGIVADLAEFLEAEPVYADLGLPWHRGYLFHGPPGTGKTSLAKALAGHFGMDVFYLALPAIPNDTTLLQLLSNLAPRSLLLIEDVDIAHGARKRDDTEPGVTMSGLLNGLDGMLTPHGLVTCLTTNDLAVIDPALVRPGRVDRSEEVGYVDDYQLAGLVALAVPGPLVLPPLNGHHVSPAAVVEVVKRHLGDHAATADALRALVGG